MGMLESASPCRTPSKSHICMGHDLRQASRTMIQWTSNARRWRLQHNPNRTLPRTSEAYLLLHDRCPLPRLLHIGARFQGLRLCNFLISAIFQGVRRCQAPFPARIATVRKSQERYMLQPFNMYWRPIDSKDPTPLSYQTTPSERHTTNILASEIQTVIMMINVITQCINEYPTVWIDWRGPACNSR